MYLISNKSSCSSTCGWTSIVVGGVVQGVGFRPTVYRVASEMGLDGTVENAIDGVHIIVRASESEARGLIDAVAKALPPMARIDTVAISPADEPESSPGFHIVYSSRNPERRTTDVSPDVAICAACLDDIAHQERRIGYPLTNCTCCGPRFSIIKELPYDRPATSMAIFPMCPDCRREYDDPSDRRFHAQPIACNHCGPRYSMTFPDGSPAIVRYDEIVSRCADMLRKADIVMVKGLGGYNLMCDATCQEALERLREMKHRPRKPFAVMAADISEARRWVEMTDAEALALSSWRAPIVILPRRGDTCLPPDLAPRCTTLGVMLPYMAFQHHIASRVPLTVVTSANRPATPMMTDDDEAVAYARDHNIPLVSYNRQIVHRVDDSVVRLVGRHVQLLRRSRGYAPEKLSIGSDCTGIVGMGADIVSQWALGRDGDIIQSQYIGSLDDYGAVESYRSSLQELTALFRTVPRMVVADAHPGYVSSSIGRSLASRLDIPCLTAWHHHAHAVAVMAEYGLEGQVLALVLDGTGAGPDGTVWGSELLSCTRTGFNRLAHGPYFPLPGGDKASLQPWRMAVSMVLTLTGSLERLPRSLREAVGEESVTVVEHMVRRGINSPLSCGAGRVWDAVAALLGLALDNAYEAEAPVILENAARGYEPVPYPLSPDPLDLTPVMEGVLSDIEAQRPAGEISARFHASYALGWSRAAAAAGRATGLSLIVLSGGVMQNALLTSLLRRFLADEGISALLPFKVPCGDAGIAVGQVAIGAATIAPGRGGSGLPSNDIKQTPDIDLF